MAAVVVVGEVTQTAVVVEVAAEADLTRTDVTITMISSSREGTTRGTTMVVVVVGEGVVVGGVILEIRTTMHLGLKLRSLDFSLTQVRLS